MSESIKDAVLASMNTKIVAGEQLQQALEHETTIAQQLTDARRATTAARKAALKAGWDERSLRRIGLLGPPPRPRKKQRQQPQETTTETGQDWVADR